MADTKLSALTALTASPATGDQIYLRDISESAADESKRITADDFMFGDAGTPTTQDYGDSAAKGTAIEAARIDHKHAMPAAGNDISCLTYNSGTQSCANTALVQLTFDVDVYNTDTNHATANRLTATTAGKYVIVGSIGWAANGTGYRLMRIYKEGTDIIAEQYFAAVSSSANHYMNVSAQIYLDATEFVILQVEQGSGGSLDVLASTSAHFRGCSFGFMKVLG